MHSFRASCYASTAPSGKNVAIIEAIAWITLALITLGIACVLVARWSGLWR
jgi:hypothetical protein